MSTVRRAIFRDSLLVIPLMLLASGTLLASGAKSSWRYQGRFVVTRYTSDERCCGKWADGYTFTGTRARYGVVAVDPRVIPLGSKLKVEGFKGVVFRAEDIGGAIKGKKIDIWHYSYDYCIRWGKQRRGVWVQPGKRPRPERRRSALDHVGDALVSVPKFVIEGLGGVIDALAAG